jgi:hypothetical protein
LYGAIFATVCLVGCALWLGTLFSVSWLCGRATTMPEGPEIGHLAISLFRRWTLPSLAVSLIAGVLWSGAAVHVGRQAQWLYGLPVVGLAFIVLSGAVGRRAKRLARGSPASTRDERTRFPLTGDCRIQRV